MLYLLFELGAEARGRGASTASRYALEASRVVEVVPLLSLKRIPQAPNGVAGMFVYRGRAIPALDLCELTFGRPARERLSTRIIIVDCSEPAGRNQLLGLIAERATEMMRRDPRDFQEAESTEHGAGSSALPAPRSLLPFLGPALVDDRGVIQLLHAQKLLAENVRELVFAPTVETRPVE